MTRLGKYTSFFTSLVGVALTVVLTTNVYSAENGSTASSSTETIKANFYVASNGNDAWSGVVSAPNASHTDGPFATLERARVAVREYKKNLSSPETIVVEVATGRYDLNASFQLTSEDSGMDEDSPVIWRAKPGDDVVVNAGVYLKVPCKLVDEKVLSVLKQEVRDKIVVIDLDGQTDDLGTPDNSPELFFQGSPTRIARYPNEGFVKITELQREGTDEVDIRGTKGIAQGLIFFDDEELLKCVNEKELWFDGYWFWDWCEQKHRVLAIDVEKKMASLQPPFHEYGYRVGQWFYAFNALCQLDAPGEYYIDRDAKLLYVYPTTDDWKEGDFLLTKNPNVLELKDVSNLVWSGFKMYGARGQGIVGSGLLHNVVIEKCDISNVGGGGISFNGVHCVVSECELWNLGRGGISVTGGDRNTLEGGDIKVVENYIHDYARIQRVYAPGVTVNGVGLYVAHNLIENAPHMGMGFGGNDHLIEYNEVRNVCFESNDAGAIYTGRNWTMRGNVLRFNYLHDISGFQNNGCVGIYLDDMFSSAEISSNLFVKVTRAAFIGGGRDSKINNNVFVDCHPALHVDARGDGWAHDHIDGWLNEAKEHGTLSGIKFKEPPYSTRYPELASILDEGKTPPLPEGNEVIGNICVGGFWDVNKHGQWQGSTVEDKARGLLKMERNFVAESDDGSYFVDPEHGDYRLKEDSSLVKDGYRSLPVAEMGLTSLRMKEKVNAR